jgi:antitoxin VapB
MVVAKVFQNGRSQAIRLPKELRVDTSEVYLKRTRDGFLVITKDPWEIFEEGVEALSDSFFEAGRQQPERPSRKWDE